MSAATSGRWTRLTSRLSVRTAGDSQGEASRPSLAGSSLVRLLGEVAGAGGALLASAITARNLGPANKGVLSTLSFIGVLAAAAGGLGLGESWTTRRRTHGETEATGAFTILLVAGAVAAGAATVAAGVALFWSRWEILDGSVLAAGLAATTYVMFSVLVITADGLGLAHRAGLSRVVVASVLVPTTALLVTILDFAILGALVSTVIAWICGSAVLLSGRVLRSATTWTRPSADAFRALLRAGAPIQLATIVLVAATRVDLVLVLGVRGDADAGLYGIAVTTASVATYPALSLVAASLSTLARTDETGLRDVTARLVRTTLLVTSVSAAMIAVVTPVLVPAAFGSGFRPAVPMTLVLLVGSVASGGQWAVGRTLAMRGRGRAYLGSYVGALLVMLTLDAVLIPAAGATGAAVAAVLASIAGFLFSFLGLRSVVDVPVRALIPSRRDIALIAAVLSRVVPRRVSG